MKKSQTGRIARAVSLCFLLHFIGLSSFFFSNFNLHTLNAQTWSEDVAPILYKHCTTCHHPGGIGLFSLRKYDQAAQNALAIEYMVSQGLMPPWPPDTAFQHHVGERVLTASEKNTILAWVTAGAPRGDSIYAPPAPEYIFNSEIPDYDLELQIPTYTVNTPLLDMYRCFVLDPQLLQNTYITAMEVIPGNRELVHHVIAYYDTSAIPLQLDANDPGPGYTNYGGTGSPFSQALNGYVPGATAYFSPVGTGYLIPAGAKLVLQIHYPAGIANEVDSTRIRLKLSTGPLRQVFTDAALNHYQLDNGPLFIPANTTPTFYASYFVTGNVSVLGAFPHMHNIGKSIKTWANAVGTNDTIPFVDIPEWDFHWQGNYMFPEIKKVEAGSTLRSEAYYDNTTNNDHNPNNPPLDVYLGDFTDDEMMLVYFTWMVYQNGDENIIVDRRIKANGATALCDGFSVRLEALNGAAVGYGYQWYRDGLPVLNATNHYYQASQSGQYYCHITKGTNFADSDSILVLVNPNPVAAMTPLAPQYCTTDLAVTLNASPPGGVFGGPGVNGNQFDPLTAGIGNRGLRYVFRDVNGCYGVDSAFTEVAVCTGLEGMTEAEELEFSVFPNPSTGLVTLSGLPRDRHLGLHDLNGKLIRTYDLSNGQNQIDLGDLPKGVWILKPLSPEFQGPGVRVLIR